MTAKRRTRKKWASRLRRMGLPAGLLCYAQTWRQALGICLYLKASNDALMDSIDWGARGLSTWLSAPPEPTSLAEMYLDALNRADTGASPAQCALRKTPHED